MGQRHIQGEVINKFLSEWPKDKIDTRQMARMIYKQNPSVFTSQDSCYALLRYYLGKAGDKQRKAIASNEHFKVTKYHNPYDLPIPTEIPETKDYHFPYDMYKRILVMSDIHVPFHDINAVNLAFDFGREHKVDAILLLGDMFDHHTISRYQKDPRKRHFKDELSQGRQLFHAIRKQFKKAAIFFKIGNHDTWYEKYMWQKAPELLDIPEFELEEIYDLNLLDIRVIGDRQIMRYGEHLWLMHGHEAFTWYSPVNAARGIFNKTLSHTVVGHKHRTSMHSEPTLGGRRISTWSLGCLCVCWMEYARINKWDNGFGYLQPKGDGDYEMQLKQIVLEYAKDSNDLIKATVF